MVRDGLLASKSFEANVQNSSLEAPGGAGGSFIGLLLVAARHPGHVQCMDGYAQSGATICNAGSLLAPPSAYVKSYSAASSFIYSSLDEIDRHNLKPAPPKGK
jgi:hypothetical protein